mmetsp:Transcript_60172/g.138024  ORF Transcript_60172/g.138024 Transcript_60172/m.138024 type:complete len:183 (-) Transcript_60172:324-872(-)
MMFILVAVAAALMPLAASLSINERTSMLRRTAHSRASSPSGVFELGKLLSNSGDAPNNRPGGDVDDIPFGGAVGGGVLTRNGIRDAQRNTAPVIVSEQRLQEAVKGAGTLAPAEAVEMLERVIGEAYTAGVSPSSPPMRAAAALLNALEVAAARGQTDEPDDPLADKLNSLFADEYAMPDID